MPIKPENRHLYPPDWKDIRQRTLEGARYRCQCRQGCDAMHHALGHWERREMLGGARWVWVPLHGNMHHDAWGAGLDDDTGERLTWAEAHRLARNFNDAMTRDAERVIVIVLTVAHLDHDPRNCDPRNLAALCQRHHLAYDQQLHRTNAYATRRARRAVGDLFEGNP